MPITQGLTNIGSIFIGETPIASVYQGTDLLYQSEITYELLYELNVTSAATQIDIEDLNITKDDEVRLVYTISGVSDFLMYVNNNTTNSNYYTQRLVGQSTTISAARYNLPYIFWSESSGKFSGFADIKVSNNDRVVAQSQWNRAIGSASSVSHNENVNYVGTSTVSTITKLSLVAITTNGFGVGSKIALYKVNGGTA